MQYNKIDCELKANGEIKYKATGSSKGGNRTWIIEKQNSHEELKPHQEEEFEQVKL